MIMAHDKKEGTIYMTSGSTASILVASSDVDASTWHHRIGHMSERGRRKRRDEDKIKREIGPFHFS